jgi:inner membrane protein
MEPVTHFLTGACLARTGFNRKTAYATLAMTLAAEAPDIDIFWGFGGPVTAFRHHRGITHTLIAAPILAAVTVAAVYLWHRFKTRKILRSSLRPRWLMLWLLAMLAHCSHLLLDYTNNYGLRPFFPFSGKWYEADLVFIVEPLLLAVLIVALVLPLILRLVDQEISHTTHHYRRNKYRGRTFAAIALMFMCGLWLLRAVEHHRAIALTIEESPPDEFVQRIAAEPYPVDPFRWHTIVDAGPYYRAAEVNTLGQLVNSDPTQDVSYKPADTPATLTAKKSPLGRVYLDWSKYPLVEESGKYGKWTEVTFRDLRFTYFGFAFLAGDSPPLSASEQIAPDGTISEVRMNGHTQN